MGTSKETNGCCLKQRKRLMRELRGCDYCSTSYKEHQRCYEAATIRNNHRGRTCTATQ